MDTDPDRRALPWPRVHSAAGWVGYLCVVPLVLGLAAVGLLPDYAARELAQRTTHRLGRGAARLQGRGALGAGARRTPAVERRSACAGALAPAVIGCAAVVIAGQRALALLVIGFGGFWLYEHRVLAACAAGGLPEPAAQLSIAICVVLALTMFVSDGAGTRLMS